MREHEAVTRARADVDVRLVGPEAWELWRQGRLQALADSPDAFGSTYEREAAFTEREWRERLGPDSASVLGCADGVPVAMGAAFVEADTWSHVVAMWVDPAWRRLGLSSRLLDVIVAWADERSLRTHLDVALGNDAARAAYERYGFVGTGETTPLRTGSSLLLERMVLVKDAARSPQISDS